MWLRRPKTVASEHNHKPTPPKMLLYFELLPRIYVVFRPEGPLCRSHTFDTVRPLPIPPTLVAAEVMF